MRESRRARAGFHAAACAHLPGVSMPARCSRSFSGPLAALASIVFWTTSIPARQDRAATARIVVGPDILASRDGTFAHVEATVAANPRDARNLLGAAITFSRPDGGTACRTYASFDGGSSWTPADVPEQLESGGGDPQVAFTPHGTALFAALTTGRTGSTLH